MRQKSTAKVGNVPKIWLSSKEAQEYIGMGPDFLEGLRNGSHGVLLSYYRIGNTIFYLKDDIDNLIIKNKVI